MRILLKLFFVMCLCNVLSSCHDPVFDIEAKRIGNELWFHCYKWENNWSGRQTQKICKDVKECEDYCTSMRVKYEMEQK